jgi:hypothetical protein
LNTLFTSVQYAEQVSEQSLAELLCMTMQTNPAALMVLCADNLSLELSIIERFLQQQPIPVFGGIFPGLLYAGEVKNSGVLIAGLSQNVHIELISDLSKKPTPKFEIQQNLLTSPSMMVLVDGLARNIDPHLQHLFNQVGHNMCVVGGGAGSMSFVQNPCLFSNQGVSEDAMLLVSMANKIELAIAHGWEKLAGPYLANQVDDNVIEQLNFQPALEVYQQVVEHHSGVKFNEHEFFDIAKTYPFGIERLDDDVLVRDPITTKQHKMVCVGKIPENTMLYILKGQADNLINASVAAVRHVMAEKATTHTFVDCFLFDCISRQLFLQDRFVEELQAISRSVDASRAIVGVLVLGEIASSVSGSINFHNKTAVIALSFTQTDYTQNHWNCTAAANE